MQHEQGHAPNSDDTARAADGYRWIPQDCPVCELTPTRFLGKRGGSAHRTGLGVTCDIWQCRRCGLVFPNPMPIPIGGLDQHYAVDADGYFQHHDRDTKCTGVHNMLNSAAELTGGKGRILDVGAGRGELLKAARRLRSVALQTLLLMS